MCVHWSWLHLRLQHAIFVVNLEIESFVSSLGHIHDQLRPSWVFARHNLNVCSDEMLTTVRSIGSKSKTRILHVSNWYICAIIQRDSDILSPIRLHSSIKVHCKDLIQFGAIGSHLDNWNFIVTYCLSDGPTMKDCMLQICFVRLRALHLLW